MPLVDALAGMRAPQSALTMDRPREAPPLITTENCIDHAAPPDAIYRLAAATERWHRPVAALPFVRVLAENGPRTHGRNGGQVRMGAAALDG